MSDAWETSQAEVDALEYDHDTAPLDLATSRDIHTGKWRCEACDKTFDHRGVANRHALSHRGDAGRTFACTVCTAKFPSTTALKRHQASHSENRPHICPNCSSAFQTRNYLHQHLATHEQHLRHECKHCARRFLTRAKLANHEMTHRSRVAWLSCGTGCGRFFATERTRQAHELTCQGQPLTEDLVHAPGALSTAPKRVGHKIVTKQTQNA